MKYSEAKQGRVFVIRLEDGDIVHDEIEKICRDNSITCGTVVIVGGADKGSKLIIGPKNDREVPVKPVSIELDQMREVTGTGTIFPDETGKPVLHMHMACGRNTSTITGCIREGVKVWHVMEAVLTELTDSTAVRQPDRDTGFKLLEP